MRAHCRVFALNDESSVTQSVSYLCRYRAARAAKNIDIVNCAYISQTRQHCYHTDQATWCYEQEQAN